MTSKNPPRKNDQGSTFLTRLRGGGLCFQMVILGVAVLVFFLIILPVAHWWEGRIGLIASATAGGVCLVGGLLALAVSRIFSGSNNAWAGVLAGMFPRMGIPLAAVLFLENWGGPLAETGFLYYLIVFYLMTLGVETIVTLPAEQSLGKEIQPSSNDVAS